MRQQKSNKINAFLKPHDWFEMASELDPGIFPSQWTSHFEQFLTLIREYALWPGIKIVVEYQLRNLQNPRHP
jgi:hypothetical protein